MRKKHLIAVLSLFLLVPALITWAQTSTISGTVSMEQQYRTINFSSPNGNVKIILPGNLSGFGSGAVMLSGTVLAEPAGKTEKEKANFLKALQKMVLSLAGQTIPIITGSDFFTLSMPANLGTSLSIVFEEQGIQTATVMLKNPVVTPPPATGTLAKGQPSLFTDQDIYLTNGNIPVYAANNTATLFQPSDKFFTKNASGNMMEAKIVAQSATETILSSHGLSPGLTTIVRQSEKHTDQVNVRLLNLTLSCPNTNLNKGQKSVLTIMLDPKNSDKNFSEPKQDSMISLDVINLTSGVVDLEKGNMQVLTFPTKSKNNASSNWQTTRTITGITPGTFNISATLYPSTVFNNPIDAQQKTLNSPADFNRWVEGIKKDLDVYIKKHDKDANGMKAVAQYALGHIPFCSDVNELEICKWSASYLLRFIYDLKPAIVKGAAAFAAYQATCKSLFNESVKTNNLVHTDIIENGLNLIEHTNGFMNYEALKERLHVAKNTAEALNNEYSANNISLVTIALNELNATAVVASMLTTSFYSIGWSFSCEECTKICAKLKTDCELGKHFKAEPIAGMHFKDKKGHSWQKKRLYQYECREESCYNMWGDLCCAYRIQTDAVEVNDGDYWEEGIPNATGEITWGPPHESMPCQCGTLYDILNRVYLTAFLEGYSWEERNEKLESQIRLNCPDLTMAELPNMAKNCGFAGAEKKLTEVKGLDLIHWLEGILEGMFHEMHEK
jgi:hypothetical protein